MRSNERLSRGAGQPLSAPRVTASGVPEVYPRTVAPRRLLCFDNLLQPSCQPHQPRRVRLSRMLLAPRDKRPRLRHRAHRPSRRCSAGRQAITIRPSFPATLHATAPPMDAPTPALSVTQFHLGTSVCTEVMKSESVGALTPDRVCVHTVERHQRSTTTTKTFLIN